MKQEIGQKVMSIEAKIQSTNVQVAQSETDNIAMQLQINSMEQEVLRLATETNAFRFFEGNAVNGFKKIEEKIKEQADQGYGLGGGQV